MNNYAVEDWNPIHLFPRELPGSRPLPTSIYGVTPVIDPVSLCGSASGSSIRCLTQCPLPCDHSCISIFFPYLGVLLLFGGFLIFFFRILSFRLKCWCSLGFRGPLSYFLILHKFFRISLPYVSQIHVWTMTSLPSSVIVCTRIITYTCWVQTRSRAATIQALMIYQFTESTSNPVW